MVSRLSVDHDRNVRVIWLVALVLNLVTMASQFLRTGNVDLAISILLAVSVSAVLYTWGFLKL